MLPVYHDAGKGHARPIRSINLCSRMKGWIRSIFESPESRNIFLFLLVNLTFAFVELTYGLITNSLGLISDSFHMFFDCTALVGGLVASLIARKSPNERYPFGYGRAEVLGGFVNGLFLVFISFFIFKEAAERFLDPPTVHTHRLLTVAVMGLVVNLIGIFALGHGHSHGGGDHGHSHGGSSSSSKSSCSGHHDHNDHHGHSHSNHHGHDHHGHDHHGHDHHGGACESSGKSGNQRNYIMDGVMLHIMADCLGSVGVITSSILIHQFGWMVADAVCSLFISVMIFASTVPLIKGSLEILMQRTPRALEPKLYDCYRRVNNIHGVISYREPHFWSLGASNYVGSIVVVIAQDANDTYVQKSVSTIFRDAGVGKMVVQTDRF